MFIYGLLVGAVAFVLYVSVRAVFRVDEGHVAVLTTFGAAETVPGDHARLRTFGPGLHFKLPWSKALRVSLKERNLDLSGQTAMGADGTVLTFDSILRFSPKKEELNQFLFELARPLEHMNGLFTSLLRTEIADLKAQGDTSAETAGGSYGVVRRYRRELNERIDAFARKALADRYGVAFSAIDLTDIHPPEELASALNAVIHAQTDAETRFAHAEADCQQRLLAAQRGVQIAQQQATAAEQEIAELALHLERLQVQGTLDAYVERRRVEVLSQSRTLFLRSAS